MPAQANWSHPLVSLVSRLMVAQAGVSGVLGVAFSRRNPTWLVVTALVTIAVLSLAALVRSGTPSAWLVALSAEAGLVTVGLFRFAFARYMGGTLLAIITLGTLAHPTVARAFSRRAAVRRGVPRQSLAED